MHQAYGGGAPDPARITGGRRYLLALRRYRWMALAIVALGTGMGVVVARGAQQKYTARATLWIETGRAQETGAPIRSGELLQQGAWVDLLRSSAVLEPVVREQRLYVSPHAQADSALFRDFGATDALVPGDYRLAVDPRGTFTLYADGDSVVQRGTAGQAVGAAAGFRWAPPASRLRPGSEVAFSVAAPGEVAQRLAEQVKTRMAEDGSFLSLELSGTNPARLRRTLGALTDRYVAVAADLKRARLGELSGILDEQLAFAAQNLRDEEGALEGFRVRTATLPSDRGVAGAGAAPADPTFANFFSLSVEREQARRDREALERALGTPGPGGGISTSALEAVPAVRASSAMTSVLQQLTAKRAELGALSTRFTEEYRPVRQAQQDVQELEQRAIPSLASSLVAELRAREASLDRHLGTASGQLRQAPSRAIEEARLRRRAEIAENLFRTLQARRDEARLAAATAVPDIRVLDAASASREGQGGSPMLVMLLWFAGSCAAAAAGAVGLDRASSRLHYPEQVTQDLGLPILGTVPNVHRVGRMAGAQARAQAVEAFRVIRLNLRFAAQGQSGPLTVAISSPAAGDGKSFVAANLAIAFAELGERVLLIDGDTRRGTLHQRFETPRRPGLTDFLAGRLTREEMVQPTGYPNLELIPSGTRMLNGPELLGSAAMAELLATVRGQYDVVLVDTPPLGAGVDPLIFGTLTRDMLLVLRSGATHRGVADNMLDVLDRLPVRVLGGVLNDVSDGGVYSYYGYLPGYAAHDEEGSVDVPRRRLQGV
jgi:capsular exopolysaccharide synthesis family protein